MGTPCTHPFCPSSEPVHHASSRCADHRPGGVPVFAKLSGVPKVKIEYLPSGSMSERYLVGDVTHREDGPAIITTRPDGSIEEEQWVAYGEHHRLGGPAVVRRYLVERGNRPGIEEWWVDGILHREDGPALGTFASDGSRVVSDYYRRGVLHREGGPASSEGGSGRGTGSEAWYYDGKLSRLDGPARTSFEDGERRVTYSVQGIEYGDRADAFFRVLSRLVPSGDIEKEFARGHLGGLLASGRTVTEILGALGTGLVTAEGVAACLDGAPLEWARAFEDGSLG